MHIHAYTFPLKFQCYHWQHTVEFKSNQNQNHFNWRGGGKFLVDCGLFDYSFGDVILWMRQFSDSV